MAGARAMPYDVALARAVEQIPAPSALEGGCRYEPKWDGYLHCTRGPATRQEGRRDGGCLGRFRWFGVGGSPRP